MIDIVKLGAHDALPQSPERAVIVLRRFEEDRPAETAVQIILTGPEPDTVHPRRADGTPMDLDEATAAAQTVAEREGIARVLVVDRVQGQREQVIMEHGGDHSIRMDELSDTDPEDGEEGADMRDVAHPVRQQTV